MVFGAVLMMLAVTAPDLYLAANAVRPIITPTPVMTQPALVQLTINSEQLIITEPAAKTPPKETAREPEKYDNAWAFYLVDKDNPLPAGFEVMLFALGEEDEWWREVDLRIAGYVGQMLEDSARDGVHIVIIEGYRTIERQQEIYDRRINYYLELGLTPAQALLVTDTEVARPGASEHNAGLALDFASGNYDVYSFEETAEFAWLAENSWRYGFILRYPEDAMHITGFIYEPWHYRFVGVKRAREITESGLTLEEFLMQLCAE